MCCGQPVARVTRIGRDGRRITQPANTKRTWIVTYPDGSTKEFTGGKIQELAANREAAQHRGSVQLKEPSSDESA